MIVRPPASTSPGPSAPGAFGRPDAARRPDAGRPDAGRPDAGRPDAARRPDAGHPDAGHPDAGRPGPARRPGALRAITRLGLVAALLVPLLSGSLGSPPVATGDELSDALARQKALKAKIADQKTKVAELNGLQADLRVVISSTTAQLAGINADLASVKVSVKQMSAKVNAVQKVYNGQVAQLADLDAQLAEIQAEEQAKAAELDQRKALLADHIRAAYDSDRTSLLETLLSADSFADAINDVGYLIDIGDQDKALAQQIARDQETLFALSQTVTQTRFDTGQLRAETAAQKKVLDQSLADLKQARARLKKLEAATAKQLALQRRAYQTLATNAAVAKRLLAQEARANAAVQRKINRLLADQLNGGGIPSEYSGSLVWPLGGTVTQEFGCTGFSWEPPLGNCRHFHIGIDIADPLGTPIHAAGDGKVLYAGPLNDGAWVVIIAHSQHLLSLYGHVKRNIPVRAGEFVHQGQLIAYVGMTGHTTGPHLHWGVEIDRTWVNPRLFL